MNNNNMINPANFYNPFAKYNYVSKTRGVYIPKDTQPLLSNQQIKSSSIFSDNYDPELDIQQAMNNEANEVSLVNIKNFFKNLFT